MTPKLSTYGIVARDRDVAVVLRRGPTNQVRLLRWDLRDDAILGGQWLKGTVFPGTCGLSPNGRLFVYEARKRGKTFTVISRPPYFSALAFWEYSSPWRCGGFFASDTCVVLGLHFGEAYDPGTFPRGFEVTNAITYAGGLERLRTIDAAPEAHHGWRADRKVSAARPHLTLERVRLAPRGRARFRVLDETSGTAHELGERDWADWAHDGSVLSGIGPTLLRDDRIVLELDDHFERILPPPEARRW